MPRLALWRSSCPISGYCGKGNRPARVERSCQDHKPCGEPPCMETAKERPRSWQPLLRGARRRPTLPDRQPPLRTGNSGPGTNFPFSDWPIILPSAATVTAMIDRVVHRADIIPIEGESYRHRGAASARKPPRDTSEVYRGELFLGNSEDWRDAGQLVEVRFSPTCWSQRPPGPVPEGADPRDGMSDHDRTDTRGLTRLERVPHRATTPEASRSTSKL